MHVNEKMKIHLLHVQPWNALRASTTLSFRQVQQDKLVNSRREFLLARNGKLTQTSNDAVLYYSEQSMRMVYG